MEGVVLSYIRTTNIHILTYVCNQFIREEEKIGEIKFYIQIATIVYWRTFEKDFWVQFFNYFLNSQ